MRSASSGVDIGWCPSGERSMIDRRRWPSPTRPSAEIHAPASSGPRWRWASHRIPSSRSPTRAPPRYARIPAIPHTARQSSQPRVRRRGPLVAEPAMLRPRVTSSVLLGLTGLRIDGGIACVGRCMARALDECCEAGSLARVDRVLLLEDPARAAAPPFAGSQWLARGSQPRFAWQLWRTFRRQRHELVLFDLVGLARATLLPLPGFPPPRMAIFAHGIELGTAR